MMLKPIKILAINALSVKKISEWCKKNQCLLLHYSTDYIFSGKNNKPWNENSVPSPINFYGKSKLDVIMYKVFQFALEGKPWAVQFIADRTEGKAKEFREVTHNNQAIKVLTID